MRDGDPNLRNIPGGAKSSKWLSPAADILDCLNPKLLRFDTVLICQLFQLIAIRDFHFIVLTHTPIHTHTHTR